jgi:hypothetical protein
VWPTSSDDRWLNRRVQPARGSDVDLTCQVIERIQDDPGLAGEFITVEVQNHVVNLIGTVSSLYARIAAADLARSTPGVVDICNRLAFAGVSDATGRQHLGGGPVRRHRCGLAHPPVAGPAHEDRTAPPAGGNATHRGRPTGRGSRHPLARAGTPASGRRPGGRRLPDRRGDAGRHGRSDILLTGAVPRRPARSVCRRPQAAGRAARAYCRVPGLPAAGYARLAAVRRRRQETRPHGLVGCSTASASARERNLLICRYSGSATMSAKACRDG